MQNGRWKMKTDNDKWQTMESDIPWGTDNAE